MSYDYDRVGLLLHVTDGTRHHPKLKAIHDAAMKELEFLASKPEEKADDQTTAETQNERRV